MTVPLVHDVWAVRQLCIMISSPGDHRAVDYQVDHCNPMLIFFLW